MKKQQQNINNKNKLGKIIYSQNFHEIYIEYIYIYIYTAREVIEIEEGENSVLFGFPSVTA